MESPGIIFPAKELEVRMPPTTVPFELRLLTRMIPSLSGGTLNVTQALLLLLQKWVVSTLTATEAHFIVLVRPLLVMTLLVDPTGTPDAQLEAVITSGRFRRKT